MDHDLVTAFWENAKRRARLTGVLPAYLGPTVLASVQPPAWSFGGTPEEADRRVEALIDGTLTATATPVAEYDASDSMPAAGDLGIVLDGSERPRALVSTTDVRIVPFAELTGGTTDHAEGIAPDEKVVLETYKVLFSDD